MSALKEKREALFMKRFVVAAITFNQRFIIFEAPLHFVFKERVVVVTEKPGRATLKQHSLNHTLCFVVCRNICHRYMIITDTRQCVNETKNNV